MKKYKSKDSFIKNDSNKIRPTLIPAESIEKLTEVLEYGANKYSIDNWKKVDNIQRYKDAAYRHFLEYLKDPSSIDNESGLLHIDHLFANVMFLSYLNNK